MGRPKENGLYSFRDYTCVVCSKKYSSRNITSRFCSRSCMAKVRKPNLGKVRSEATKLKMSLKMQGKNSGPDNYQWINERTNDREKRRLKKPRIWIPFRESIFQRDNNKCVECSGTENLEPHHIIPIRDRIDLMYDSKNVVTLCNSCHNKTKFKEVNFIEKYTKLTHREEVGYCSIIHKR